MESLPERLKSLKTKQTPIYNSRHQAIAPAALGMFQTGLPGRRRALLVESAYESVWKVKDNVDSAAAQEPETKARLLFFDGPKSSEQLGEPPSSSRTNARESFKCFPMLF